MFLSVLEQLMPFSEKSVQSKIQKVIDGVSLGQPLGEALAKHWPNSDLLRIYLMDMFSHELAPQFGFKEDYLLKPYLDFLKQRIGIKDAKALEVLDLLWLFSFFIQNGLSIHQALVKVRTFCKGPLVTGPLNTIIKQMQEGKDLKQSLPQFSNSFGYKEIRIFAENLLIMNEVGGNIADAVNFSILSLVKKRKLTKEPKRNNM